MTGFWLVGLAAVLVVVGAVLHRAGVIDLSDKTRRSGGYSGALGAADEVFAPSKYEAQVELDRQSALPAPAPLAGDGDKGVYAGRLTIRL
ncbi:hypothetical protein QT381_13060 [Galbitalea sp. SE-J8]|uniref:hypothetical protein n=1 Tax=Galbitalea sp. SE-J8 TaxID=3054952 RepID=UPI00259CD765|nr:hypothetical protein [Galbitalea sp. SE-J8]MDM4763937.1 hypothetical protein [Galbitalea sp. SE-J8]